MPPSLPPRRIHLTCTLALLVIGLAAASLWTSRPVLGAHGLPISDLPLVLPGPETPPPWMGPALQERALVRPDPETLDALDGLLDQMDRELQGKTRAPSSAAGWRRLAETLVARHAYAQAAAAYQKEADFYQRLGDSNAAQIEGQKAKRYATELVLYHRRPATAQDAARLYTHARLEPRVGCYLGAFIDRDDNLEQFSLDSQRYGSIDDFNAKTGKKHVSFFMYRTYGEPFPTRWAQQVIEHGAIPDIAWEPRRLSDVQDDAYLQQWVEQARQLDGPVFLRFASEFNGTWVRYHGDPAAYKRAFRTVYTAFRAAPKVALIWCPNSVPRQGIDAYYPGDHYTDWVGCNFYSVVYEDNDRHRPAAFVVPGDLFEHVYRRYAARKPMAIGEWAATHQTSVDPTACPEFAVDKIAEFYQSLPDRYPRVKLVNWFDCNTLQHAPEGRQLNDYCVTDDPLVLSEYRYEVASHAFLGARDGRPGFVVTAVPLRNGERVGSRSTLDAYVRTFIPRPAVYFKIDGRLVYATNQPGRHSIALTGLTPGAHTVQVLVYDDQNHMIISKKATVVR